MSVVGVSVAAQQQLLCLDSDLESRVYYYESKRREGVSSVVRRSSSLR